MLKNKQIDKITIQDLISAQSNFIRAIQDRKLDQNTALDMAEDILVGMNSIYNRMTDKNLSG